MLSLPRLLLYAASLSIALPFFVDGAIPDWLSAPKPKFPASALKNGSEGSVKLQVVLSKDGRVTETTVLRSSGDSVLDAAAQQSVSKWKMKPSAIKPSDLTKGRETIVQFRQEAPIASVYLDRKAYFKDWRDADIWMLAPFPEYSRNARRQHHTGTVIVGAIIGRDGRVASLQVLHSSGHADLDEFAVKAVGLWRAHKQFSGRKCAIPVDFVMGR